MSTKFKDYYATLGVPKTATQKEVRAAFRKLARKYHPDVNKKPDAVDRFKEINEANEVLTDPEKRKKYDEFGPGWDQAHQGYQPQPGAPFGRGGDGGGQVEYHSVTPDQLQDLFGAANPFSDFFHGMFGRSGGGPGVADRAAAPARGSHVEGEVTISLEEACTGVTRLVEMSGAGTTRRVEVRIPPGIADGGRVRAAGQGGRGQGGGGAGDLLIRVHIAAHPLFEREGRTLSTRVPVPLDVALLGGSVEVPTPRGGRVHLSVPADTQNGTRLRMRGLGLPDVRNKAPGDLIAEVDVRLPVPLSPERRTLVEQLRDSE